MAMVDDDQNHTHDDGEQPTIEDETANGVIDQYIQNLERTKRDPKLRKQFMDDFVKTRNDNKEEKPETNPFKDATVEQPPRTPKEGEDDSEDDEQSEKPRRNRLEHGDPDDPKYDTPEDDESSDDEDGKKNSRTKLRDELRSFVDDDEDVDEVEKLYLVLKDCKIKDPKYILKSYFKTGHPIPSKSARELNNLLKDVDATQRIRIIVLKTYFNVKPEVIDRLIEEENDEDDDEISRSKKGKNRDLDDAEDVIEVPYTVNGQIMTKTDGTPILVKMRVKHVRAMMMQQQMSGGSGSGNINPLEIIEFTSKMNREPKEQIQKLQAEQLDFWKRASQHDSFKDISEWKGRLRELGLVGDVERPSQYQKEVIDSVRSAMKEGYSETKDEIKSLAQILREDVKPLLEKSLEATPNNGDSTNPLKLRSKSTAPKTVQPIPDLDEAFTMLNEAATEELDKEKSKKSIGVKK